MADSLVQEHSLTMPLGPVFSPETTPSPSHHFSPLYPIYLAFWFTIFSYSPLMVHIASFVLSLFFLLAIYLTHNNLYSRNIALIFTAIWSVQGTVLDVTGKCLSENLILLIMTIFFWSILKGLRRRKGHYFVLTGLMAGLGYLCKAKAGLAWFFLLVIILIIFLYFRKRLFISTSSFITASSIFLLISGSWILRNYLIFGNTTISPHNEAATSFAFQHLELWMYGIWGYSPLFCGYLLFHIFFLIPILFRINYRRFESLLFLTSSILLFMSSWIISSAVWTYEGDFLYLNATRYILPSLLPIFWLIAENIKIEEQEKVIWLKLTIFSILLFGILTMLWSFYYPEKRQVSAKDILSVELLYSQTKAGDCILITPPIGKNQYLYYYLRFHNHTKIKIFNGMSNIHGKKCNFMVSYKKDFKPPNIEYDNLANYFGRVTIWKRKRLEVLE